MTQNALVVLKFELTKNSEVRQMPLLAFVSDLSQNSSM